jgi:outer membrane protein assembly factor BamB
MAKDPSVMSELRVAGRVTDEATGAGLGGIGVSDGLEVTTTGADGRYVLTVEADRRAGTLVAMTVPTGWQARLGPLGAPEFFHRVDASGGSRVEVADFLLRRDPASVRDDYRFVALADVHVAASGLNPTEQFSKQLEEIERFAHESAGELGLPAFVTVAGDVTNDATAAEFADYVSATATSSVPVWSAPGNHDLVGRIKAGAYPKPWPDIPYQDMIEEYRRAVGPEWYSFQYGRHHFVVLENYKGLGEHDQLRWLERDLATNAGGKQVVVVAHVPWNVPQTPGPAEVDPYLALLADFDVRLLLAGHTHTNDVSANVIGRARQIVTTTTGASTLDSTPRGFRFVDVADDEFRASYWELEAHRKPTIVFPVGTVPWGPDEVRVSRYTPPGIAAVAEYQLGQEPWRRLELAGRRSWTAELEAELSGGPHQLTVRVQDRVGGAWTEESAVFGVAEQLRPVPEQGEPALMFRNDPARRGVSADQVAPPLDLVWVRHSGGTIVSSSPAIAHERVFVGVRDEDDTAATGVVACMLGSGKREWFAQTDGAVEASIAVAGDLVLAPSVRGPLRALDVGTGDVRWTWGPPSETAGSEPERCWMYFSPVVLDDRVYQAYCAKSGVWVAGLDVQTGELRWQTQEPVGRNWISHGGPTIDGDRLYLATAYANLVAVDLGTGELRWQRALGAGLGVRTVPVAVDDLVLLACQRDQLVAVDAQSGDELWRHVSGGGSLLPGAGTAASPAVADGVAYAGFTDGRVTAIDLDTGEAVWHYETRGPVLSSPIVSGNVLYVGSNDGWLRALARDTGECRWSYDLGSWLIAAPAVTGNSVVVGAWDGNVYAFAAPERMAPYQNED